MSKRTLKELRSDYDYEREPRLSTADAYIEGLEQKNTRLRSLLKWTLREIQEYADVDEDGTPEHICGFKTNPMKGACTYHETYWTAMGEVGWIEDSE